MPRPAFKNLFIYLTLLLFCLMVAVVFWTVAVEGRMYYCSDSLPFFNFLPPFVHGEQYGDYYSANPIRVWLIWGILVFLIFTLPYIFTIKLGRTKKQKIKKGEKYES